VDDNAINRRVFINLVKETEICVDEASGGLSCLDLVAVNRYDIIFLDHMMPDLDGIETFRRMRSFEDYPCKDTPVVILTANAITGAKEMYLSEGFDSFLSKPVNPDKLENMLQELLPEDKIIYEEEKEISMSKNENFDMDFPEIEGIDFEYAMFRMKNKSIYQNTIWDFYRMLDAEANELESFLQGILSGDEEAWNLYRVKVHAMKTSAAMIGAIGTSSLAKTLEYAARDKQLDFVQNVTPAFLAEWRRYKELLQEIIPEEEEKMAPDYPKIREYLVQLDNALQEMDLGFMDECMEQILMYQYPDSLQEMVSELEQSVTNIDVELASKKIEAIQSRIEQEG